MPEPVSTLGLLFGGYAAMNTWSRSGSAVSNEAGVVRRAAAALVESAQRSQLWFGAKAAAISQIWGLVTECDEPGWDGDGAQPVDRVAASVAAEFILALPDGVPLPEFAPEPDGSISLDWIQSRKRLFSLSVSATGRLAYAWLDGTDRGHAVARFDGQRIPVRILEGINDIKGSANATVGSR